MRVPDYVFTSYVSYLVQWSTDQASSSIQSLLPYTKQIALLIFMYKTNVCQAKSYLPCCGGIVVSCGAQGSPSKKSEAQTQRHQR